MKTQLEGHQSHNFLTVYPQDYAQRCQNIQNHYMRQNFFDSCFHIKSNWFTGNNTNCYQDACTFKIKRQEYDQQKYWQSQIKDEQSGSINHQHGFQAYQYPKQQQIQYPPKYSIQDPNKYLGVYIISSKEQKKNQRKQKVQSYLKKKLLRSYEKKIIYKCRKQVADQRIRYRGRFISEIQAIEILGLNQNINYNTNFLMEKIKALGHVDVKGKAVNVKEQEKNQDEKS